MSDHIEDLHERNPVGLSPVARPHIRQVSLESPVGWLKKGFDDLVRTRFRGTFYGLIFLLMGYAILWIYATRWQLTMGLVAGFFLMGPFICTGLYDLSRQYESKGSSGLIRSFTCWSDNPGSIAFFALILTFVMIVWARVSVILFALASTTSFPTLDGILGAIFSLQNLPFLFAWTGLGFFFACLVFSISVVSVPMMLERKTDTLSAIFSSVRCVQKNPLVMCVWALIVVMTIGTSLLLGFVPLLFTAPLIGHATWHAYRDLVQHESVR